MADIKYKTLNELKSLTFFQSYELLNAVKGLLECASDLNFYTDDFDESDYNFMKNRIWHIMEIIEE